MNETTPLIYIVDDENSIRKSLKRLMESEGLKAETFASAKEFLDFSYQDKSACLILDLHMPGMTGMELQEQLVESGSNMPVIIITGHDDEKNYSQVMKAGAAAYLRKPFDDQTLLRSIRLALARNTISDPDEDLTP